MPVHKILVANRGEIAVRVMRTARRLGYRTVAIHSAADAHALHVRVADEAVAVGPAPASASYLAIDRIIEAARQSGADAIHPGYGFLSENAAFARACAEAGIVFIGPSPEAIELMGHKSAAKQRMQQAGVVCVPGYEGDDQSDAAFATAAERIGFPIMVKAAAGGGGRGMRLVETAPELSDALRSARAEAESAFGSGELLLEKAIVRPRHVEVQIFGDDHGGAIHLGERDCSVQRRHQKVIEECPSPAVDAELRERMGAAAVEAARACGYSGAGTVEFLLDEQGRFYFLEMNTRLQVEHPVTELVTGVDLVSWQIRIADGERLPLQQSDVTLCGHAIEARLYAEDPAQGFLPQTGMVLAWKPADEVRVDHGIVEGQPVSPHYDPMIAKIVAHGATREEARRKLVRGLRETLLLGVKSNKAFLTRILEDESFAAGHATTAFVAERLTHDAVCRPTAPPPASFALAALVFFLEGARGIVEDQSFVGWRSAGPVWVTLELHAGEAVMALDVTASGRGEQGSRYLARWEQGQVELELLWHGEGELVVDLDGVRRCLHYALDEDRVWLDDGSGAERFENVTHRARQAAGGAGSGLLRAPLDGAVVEVFVAAGDAVARGTLVLVVEAMKMEHRIVADVDGTVAALHVAPGDQVETRQLLAEVTPDETPKEPS